MKKLFNFHTRTKKEVTIPPIIVVVLHFPLVIYNSNIYEIYKSTYMYVKSVNSKYASQVNNIWMYHQGYSKQKNKIATYFC